MPTCCSSAAGIFTTVTILSLIYIRLLDTFNEYCSTEMTLWGNTVSLNTGRHWGIFKRCQHPHIWMCWHHHGDRRVSGVQLFVSSSSRAERTASGPVADSSVLLNQNMLHVRGKNVEHLLIHCFVISHPSVASEGEPATPPTVELIRQCRYG